MLVAYLRGCSQKHAVHGAQRILVKACMCLHLGATLGCTHEGTGTAVTPIMFAKMENPLA